MVGRNVRALGCTWAVLLSLCLGCSSEVNPVQPPPPDVLARCEGLRPSCRRHVYILVINGFDPTEVTNAVGLAHFLEKEGFPNVYYTSQWKAHEYEERILEIKQTDPAARVAFVCYSMGVSYGRKLAQKLKTEGSRVDLLLYLDAFARNHSPEHSPDDGRRIVNIITEPRLGIFGSEPLAGATNYQFLGIRHVKVPSDSRIIERIIDELILLADAA
jgi:hypothetical protein